MVFNYRLKSDRKKAEDFLLANNYKSVFNKMPEEYFSNYIHKNSNRILFTLSLLPQLKAGARILEIGALPFCFSTLLMETFSCEVTTIDLPQTIFPGEPYAIEKEEVEISNGMTHKKYKVSTWTCNAEKDIYPFKDGTFDVIICTEVLEHLLYSPPHVFEECKRVLKEGGLMLVSTVNSLHFKRMADIIMNNNIDDIYSPLGFYARHSRNYTRKELIQLAQDNNFKIRFFRSATLRGTRNEDGPVLASKTKKVDRKQNKFFNKLSKLPRKIFLGFIKCIVFLPLPGMKDKRHYNIFLLLEK